MHQKANSAVARAGYGVKQGSIAPWRNPFKVACITGGAALACAAVDSVRAKPRIGLRPELVECRLHHPFVSS
jgi:hypothetical protein